MKWECLKDPYLIDFLCRNGCIVPSQMTIMLVKDKPNVTVAGYLSPVKSKYLFVTYETIQYFNHYHQFYSAQSF